jgi:hypothetical protein
MTYHVSDFQWIGGAVNNIKREHAFYMHNNAGDVLLSGVNSRQLGRTFVQVTQRRAEGMVGTGVVTVEDCVVEDCALTDGGSCFTIAGHAGGAIFQNNTITMGKNPNLSRGVDTYPATGAVVVWAPNKEEDIWPDLAYQNGPVTLSGNNFEIQDGDRNIGNFGAAEALTIRDNRFATPSSSGGLGRPIVFDPYTGNEPTSRNLNNPDALDICANTLENISFVECEEADCPFDMEEACP